MNNQICELLISKKIILNSTQTLDFSKYSNKRNYKAILGVNLSDFYTLVFIRESKSKLLKAEINEINAICEKIELEFDTKINKRILFYKSAICSKLKKSAQNWKFYDFV